MKAQTKRKKRRPSRAAASTTAQPSPPVRPPAEDEEEENERKALLALMEAFDSISIEDASAAYKEANGDVNKAAEFLASLTTDDHPSTSSSVSSGVSCFDSASGSGSSSSGSASSSGSSSEGFMEGRLVGGEGFRGSHHKQKRVVAVTGTVSTMLGKEYVKASQRRDSSKTAKELFQFGNGASQRDEAEQFLCSMLADECELNLAVVRDVLCQCGYNVEKAMDALLDLSGSPSERSSNYNSATQPGNQKGHKEYADNSTDKASDSTSYSSETEQYESVWDYGYRNYAQVLTDSQAPPRTSPRTSKSEIPQEVLDSLYSITKSSTHEPHSMNWKNIVKKMQSLGPVDVSPSSEVSNQDINTKGNEYHILRESAKQHWDSMRSYYHRAATAYSKGERQYAAYLSDQGRSQTKLAEEADKKASMDIFKARNTEIKNMITIDLHGQHVKPAMKVLKLHLLFGSYVNSIQILRVITGCGSHGFGKSKLKQSVVELLEREEMEWSEENQGTLLIKIDGSKEYSFMDSDSDTESN
ncbi:SMR domain-containing protein At5g58720 [Linum grandiflorum]